MSDEPHHRPAARRQAPFTTVSNKLERARAELGVAADVCWPLTTRDVEEAAARLLDERAADPHR